MEPQINVMAKKNPVWETKQDQIECRNLIFFDFFIFWLGFLFPLPLLLRWLRHLQFSALL